MNELFFLVLIAVHLPELPASLTIKFKNMSMEFPKNPQILV